MRINIEFSQQNNNIINFSAQELVRYLSEIMSNSLISINNNEFCAAAPDLTIHLKTADLHSEYGMPPVEHPDLDDQYLISVKDCQGTIAGGNPRSVLLGVYHYLRS